MSGLAAIWCAARSRRQTKSAISLTRPTCGDELNTNLLAAGDPLAEAEREAEHGLAFAQKARFGLVIDTIATQLGLIRTLRGLTPKFGSFDDEQFDEFQDRAPFFRKSGFGVRRVLVLDPQAAGAFLCRRLCVGHRGLVEGATAVLDLPSQFETAEYHFYGALSRAASCDSAAGRRAPAACRGSGCPPQATAKSGRRIARRISRTAPRWSAPRSRASRAGSSMPSASTNRPSARPAPTALFTMRRSPTSSPPASTRRVASRRLPMCICRDARYGYLRWGADGKVRQLDERYPRLRAEEPAPDSDEHDWRAGRAAGPRDRDQGCRRPSRARLSSRT